LAVDSGVVGAHLLCQALTAPGENG